MRLALAFAALALSVPALAQTDHSQHSQRSAPRLTIETPIEAIVADPAGRAVLDATMPGITTHAMYEQFKGMTLTQLQPMSSGEITDETLAKTKAALEAVK